MYSQAYGAYRDAHANELDQAHLILMMYRGAVNFLDKAIEAGKTDKVVMSHYVSKAKSVVLELMMSLNLEDGGTMGETLLDMYQRLFKKLNVAHMRDDRSRIIEVRNSLSELEETWRRVFASDEYKSFKENPEQFKLKLMTR